MHYVIAPAMRRKGVNVTAGMAVVTTNITDKVKAAVMVITTNTVNIMVTENTVAMAITTNTKSTVAMVNTANTGVSAGADGAKVFVVC
ncbi:hypothetical protein GCM10009131_09550 [Morganella psychrotolerans]